MLVKSSHQNFSFHLIFFSLLCCLFLTILFVWDSYELNWKKKNLNFLKNNHNNCFVFYQTTIIKWRIIDSFKEKKRGSHTNTKKNTKVNYHFIFDDNIHRNWTIVEKWMNEWMKSLADRLCQSKIMIDFMWNP